MFKLKKYLICFLLLIISLTFFGCASVQALTITNDDGTIDERVYVSLDVEAVLNAGYNLEEVKNDIYLNSLNEAQEFCDKLNLKVAQDLLAVNDEESEATLRSYYNGVSVIHSVWKDNQMLMGVKFKNKDVYAYYYGISNKVSAEPTVEKGFFYNKISYTGNTMFLKHQGLYDSLANYYSFKYADLVESETNELLYTYVTDSRREHSDADSVANVDGKYYHTWKVQPNAIDKNVTIYYNVANAGNWIIVSLLASGVLTINLLIIAIIIKKFKKSKKNN